MIRNLGGDRRLRQQQLLQSETDDTHCTNCCDDCTAPFPESYTVTVYPGVNFLADNLCQGTNSTLIDQLTNVPNQSRFSCGTGRATPLPQPSIWDSGVRTSRSTPEKVLCCRCQPERHPSP